MSTENQLRAAIAGIQRSSIQKLWNPGLLRFYRRWRADKSEIGQMLDAPLFFGGHMSVILPEAVSRQIYTYGFFDEVVSWLAIKVASPGDVVFDIGGHYGFYARLFAQLVGANGRVVSFEPTPSTFEVLQRNAGACSNLTVENQAMGERDGVATIRDFGAAYCAWNTLADSARMSMEASGVKAHEFEVKLTSIDAYCARHKARPDVIKIDAENYEAAVINGGLNTLRAAMPRIIMEMGSASSQAAGEKLLDLGYQIWTSTGLDSLQRWPGALHDANAQFKDALFVHPGAAKVWRPGAA